MSSEHWSFQDAKSRFGAVIEAARRGRPQIVTRRGVPAAVVVSMEDYERFEALSHHQAPSFADHLLALPQDNGEFVRLDADLRDWE
jgi:prevent-host-death family protein